MVYFCIDHYKKGIRLLRVPVLIQYFFRIEYTDWY